jgi:tight adherence protein B
MTAAPAAGVAAALGVVALWEALAVLERSAGGRAKAVAQAMAPFAPLARALRGGREPSPPERRRLALVGVAALFATGWLIAGPIAALLAGAGGPWAVGRLLRERQRRYRAELERAAPGVARALADAIGAGHAVSGALTEAARGAEGPAAVELRAAADELALGEPTTSVLTALRRRARSRAYDTMVAAILLQQEAGGDLASLLRELASSQEETLRLTDDARAATAQARFTGVVVAVLPAGAAGLAELARPGTLASIAAVPLAAYFAAFAVVLQLIAMVAIRRLARIEG